MSEDLKTVEYTDLIATRQPPGDQWTLINDKDQIIHPTLTHALEAWFQETQEKVEFRLAPLDSKLFVIRTEQQEIIKPKPQTFNLYGE
tara:strand:- start:1373 stop:1636 length:264 start_codon:yes stop_codon:yes gene_type:complete